MRLSLSRMLTSFDEDVLERHAGSIMGLWHDCTIAYVNPAWHEFARCNDGEPAISTWWGLGASILDAISRPLLPYYVAAFSDCCHAMKPWEHVYECSNADRFRQFHMTVYPLTSNGEMLFVHSLVAERPHDPAKRPPQDADGETYRNHAGVIAQCVHCRRIQHGNDRDRWEWVPDWVRQPPSHVSDDLCPLCHDYYYGSHSRLE